MICEFRPCPHVGEITRWKAVFFEAGFTECVAVVVKPAAESAEADREGVVSEPSRAGTVRTCVCD